LIEPTKAARERAFDKPRPSLLRPMKRFVRDVMIAFQLHLFRTVYGMDIAKNCRISLKARLDKTNPQGVHIGDGTYVAFGAVILAHDMSRAMHFDTYIGSNCFIGAHAIILPGIRVGDSCIVGAGAVVTKDVPNSCLVAGNPARVVKNGIQTMQWGILVEDHARAVLNEQGGPEN
jgi:acetyltransferase-like isoleucine patch superfamily enzyme